MTKKVSDSHDCKFKPGWWLNSQLEYQYGELRNGVADRMGKAFMPVIGWLKRHPRHEGVVGRIPRTLFIELISEKVTDRNRRGRYMKAWRRDGFVSETGRFIDVGFFDDLAARRSVTHRRELANARQQAHRAGKRQAEMLRHEAPPPHRMPLTPPSEASCGTSRPLPLRAEADPPDTTGAVAQAPVSHVAVAADKPANKQQITIGPQSAQLSVTAGSGDPEGPPAQISYGPEPAALRELRAATAAPAAIEAEECGSCGSPAGMVGADRGEPQLLGLGGQTPGRFAIPAAVADRLARGEEDPTPAVGRSPGPELGFRAPEQPTYRDETGEVWRPPAAQPRPEPQPAAPHLELDPWLESIGWSAKLAGARYPLPILEQARVRVQRWNVGSGPMRDAARAFSHACRQLSSGAWERPDGMAA